MLPLEQERGHRGRATRRPAHRGRPLPFGEEGTDTG